MGRSRGSRGVLAFTLVVVLTTLAPSSDASTPSQTASSTGGMWLSGSAGHDADFPGYGVDHQYGGLMKFRVDYVDPGTVLNGDGPSGLPGEADLRRPWISIIEEHALPPEGGGSEGWLRDVRDLCSAWVNPTAVDSDIDQIRKQIRVSVDVPCTDGRGYDFYRVTWEGEIEDNAGSHLPDVAGLWGSINGGWQGNLELVKARGVTTQFLSLTMTVCGHPGTQEGNCLVDEITSGRLNAGAILTTANQDT